MNKEKLAYGLTVAAFWLNVMFTAWVAWMDIRSDLWILFLAAAMAFLFAIAIWDYRKMTKVQLVKQLALLCFTFGCGLGIAGLLWNLFQGAQSTLWVYGLLTAAISAGVGIFYGTGIDWDELRDRRADDRQPRRHGDGPYPTEPNPKNDPAKNRSHPPARNDVWFTVNDNQQQFAIAGNGGGNAINHEWGNTMTAALSKHFLLIAGLLLAIITLWFGMFNHSEAGDWTAILILGVVATVALLAYAGLLKGSLVGIGKHPTLMWLIVSIVAVVFLWKYGKDDGLTIGQMPLVWLAIASAIAAGLHLLGQLRPFLQGVGEILGKAYGFGYHSFLTLVLWGVTLIAGYVFINILVSQEFFGLDVSDEVFQVTKWIGAGGVFLVLLSPLAFKK